MKRGRIKSYAAGQGVITPDDGSADVFFLGTVVTGPGTPTIGAVVKYTLYPGSGAPEVRKVVLV
jgi:cold shock CspA family protein